MGVLAPTWVRVLQSTFDIVHLLDHRPLSKTRHAQPPGTITGRSFVLIASGMLRNSVFSLRTSRAGVGSTTSRTFSISARNSGSASVLSNADPSAFARSGGTSDAR